MSTIIDFIKQISSAIVTLINFLITIIQDILQVIELLAISIAKIPTYLVVFPAGLSAILTTVLSIVVIYKILGRTN